MNNNNNYNNPNFSYFSDNNPYNFWNDNIHEKLIHNNYIDNQNINNRFENNNNPNNINNQYQNRNNQDPNQFIQNYNQNRFNPVPNQLTYFPNYYNQNNPNLRSHYNSNNINGIYSPSMAVSTMVPISPEYINCNVKKNIMYQTPNYHTSNYQNQGNINKDNSCQRYIPNYKKNFNKSNNGKKWVNTNDNTNKKINKNKILRDQKEYYDSESKMKEDNPKSSEQSQPKNDIFTSLTKNKPHLIMTINKKDFIKSTQKQETLDKEEENDNNLEVFKIDKTRKIDLIDKKIEKIEDIVELGKLFGNEDFKDKNYSINIQGLNKMILPLEELNSLIGLENVKKKILDQIVFFSQDLHEQHTFSKRIKTDKNKEENNLQGDTNTLTDFLKKIMSENDECSSQENNFDTIENVDNMEDAQDMLHTIIEGPPGVGKTKLGKILAKIYLSLGITKNNKFRIVKRKDLIGEYLGHTAVKTQKVIDSCLGGVLFIDEAYSLGNGDSKKDSYSKECIDTINQNLSENKGKFVCIIAGYENELENDFFSVNPGLKRRFSFKYTINKYNYTELSQILIHKIKKIGWKIEPKTEEWLISSKYLESKMDKFPHFGGDIETWLLNCKIEHAKRVFGQSHEIHKIISKDDLENGYKKYLENRNTKESIIPMNMYN